MANRFFKVEYPTFAENRGAGFWGKPANVLAARRKFRIDRSSEWRDMNEQSIPLTRPGTEARTRSFTDLLPQRTETLPIRAVIVGDTGEGGRAQYGLTPLIKALNPHFMIINGDVAYPAGRAIDFVQGFFEPYNDLGIPIWAVPGNHEYYSPNKGREFVDVFCTRKHVDDWARFGLRFVPQPGTYWELSDSKLTNVTIIGVDSGHSGNLDSVDILSSDARQLEWLKMRLDKAGKEKRKVILLFHIPVLVNGKLARKPRLTRLHALIAENSCIKTVICGHIHSFQRYQRDEFAKALRDITGESIDQHHRPVYIVSGGGGAFLSSPPGRGLKYETELVYPTAIQWKSRISKSEPLLVRAQGGAVKGIRRGLAAARLSQSAVDHVFASVEETVLGDADKPSLLSLLYVEIWKDGAMITPVFLTDLSKLYSDQITLITIRNRNPPPDSNLVRNCMQSTTSI